MKNQPIKIYMRLGIEFESTVEEITAIQGNDQAMTELLKSKQIELRGNSYIPNEMSVRNMDDEVVDNETYDKVIEFADFELDNGDVKIT